VDGTLKKDAISGDAPLYTLLPSEALTDGFHAWFVVALDGTGATTQSTSTWSTRVDGTPPAAFTLLAPLADAWVGTDTPTFSWNGSSDGVSGLAQYEVWIDGISQKTGLGPSTLSSSVPLPRASIFLDNFDSCDGWTMTKIPPSAYNWTCTYQSSIQSNIMSMSAPSALVTRIGSVAISGVIDLSNLGPAQLALHESDCGAATYEISISDGSAAGFRLLRGTPPSFCKWANSQNKIDDFTGGSSSAIKITGVVTPFNSVSIDSIQILGAVGGDHTWQVVAIDLAGNRTPSDSRKLRYDLPPAPFDLSSPADSSWTNTATPTFTWNATTDAGSGLAKYQVWIDGNLAIDNIPATATTATATTAVAQGAHTWQVYAVDSAGAVRHSRQTWTLGVDMTPPAQHGINDLGNLSTPTPQICWWTFTDAGGSGLDHYSLTIDGVLSRDKIKPGTTGTDCATPTAALAEGKHTLSVTGYDTAGNSTTATGSFVVDFNPPTAFALVSPAGEPDCPACGGNVVVVDTLTPTFVWQASSSSGSGLDHYEIYLDGASTCSICNIPAAATSATLATPLYPEQHYWEMVAFDRFGGSVQGYTPSNQGDARAFFTAKCKGVCQSAPEPGPEPTPEPARDGGVDAPVDATDGPAATATFTSTATNTFTTTGTTIGTTSTNTASTTVTRTATATTGTVTATGTSVPPETRPDAAPPIAVVDATIPDTVSDPAIRADAMMSRDGAVIDAMPSAVDTTIITPTSDAAVSVAAEGGVVFADAATGGMNDTGLAGRDVGQTGTRDGAGNDSATMTSKASGGCGCVVGGANTGTVGIWPLLVLGLLMLWRGVRVRRQKADRT
jgi:MYXO-CTERM domain-containing protein